MNRLGLAIISANRPDYLEITLNSIKKQNLSDMTNIDICLFQDGCKDKNNNIIIKQELINKCISSFNYIFPAGTIYLAPRNLWINDNVKRALDTMFTSKRCDGVILIEDDVLLNPWSVGVQKALMCHTRTNEDIVMVSAANNTGFISVEEQHKLRFKPTSMSRVFFFGIWKKQWLWLKDKCKRYYDIADGDMYRTKGKDVNKKVLAYMKSINSNMTVTGHDGAWSATIRASGKTWISSNTVNAKHIGEIGVHCGPKSFSRLDGNTVMYPEDFRDFNFTDEDIRRTINIRKETFPH